MSQLPSPVRDAIEALHSEYSPDAKANDAAYSRCSIPCGVHGGER